MERIISQEERIRRAEELYNRRRYENKSRNANSGTSNKKNVGNGIGNEGIDTLRIKRKMIKKMVLQIIICAAIYLSFYLLQNSEYVFSKETLRSHAAGRRPGQPAESADGEHRQACGALRREISYY